MEDFLLAYRLGNTRFHCAVLSYSFAPFGECLFSLIILGRELPQFALALTGIALSSSPRQRRRY